MKLSEKAEGRKENEEGEKAYIPIKSPDLNNKFQIN